MKMKFTSILFNDILGMNLKTRNVAVKFKKIFHNSIKVIHLPRPSQNRLSLRQVLHNGINNQNIQYNLNQLIFTRCALHLKLYKIKETVKNENLKNDDLYIESYVFRCAENDYQLKKSKKFNLKVNLAPKQVISSRIWRSRSTSRFRSVLRQYLLFLKFLIVIIVFSASKYIGFDV